MPKDLVPSQRGRSLTPRQFLHLADVPPESEWLANITNPQTRRAYQNDLKEFMRFANISTPEAPATNVSACSARAPLPSGTKTKNACKNYFRFLGWIV